MLNLLIVQDIMVDFRTVKTPTILLTVNNQVLEMAYSFKLLVVPVSCDPSWEEQTTAVRKIQQHFFLFLPALAEDSAPVVL